MAKQKADKTLSDRIRAAALGPVPSHNAEFMSAWIGIQDYRRLGSLTDWYFIYWIGNGNDYRRMALLFLAEAVK